MTQVGNQQGARLGYVILCVADLGRTVDFYMASFGLGDRLKQESHAEIDNGETTLSPDQPSLVDEHSKQVCRKSIWRP